MLLVVMVTMSALLPVKFSVFMSVGVKVTVSALFLFLHLHVHRRQNDSVGSVTNQINKQVIDCLCAACGVV